MTDFFHGFYFGISICVLFVALSLRVARCRKGGPR